MEAAHLRLAVDLPSTLPEPHPPALGAHEEEGVSPNNPREPLTNGRFPGEIVPLLRYSGRRDQRNDK